VRTPVQGQLFGAPVAEPPRRRGEPGGGAKAPARGPDARLELATAGADRMRRKYGRGAVVSASLLGRGATRGRDGSDGRPGVAGRAAEPPARAAPTGNAE